MPIVITLLVYLSIISSPLFADSLLLKSGEVVKGKIIHEDDTLIQMDTGVGITMTYYRDELMDVTKDNQDNPRAQADALENQAVQLIDQGKRAEGLDLLKQAIALSPTALRYMNLGSVLFGDGVELFKSGDTIKGGSTLEKSKSALLNAIQEFDPNVDNIYIGQCYFLLAEMYANAFNDQEQANMLYRQAVAISEHPGAQKALEKINQ